MRKCKQEGVAATAATAAAAAGRRDKRDATFSLGDSRPIADTHGAHGGGSHNSPETRSVISRPGLAAQLRDFSSFPAHGVGKRLTSQQQHGIACNNQHFELTANRVPGSCRTLEARSRSFLFFPLCAVAARYHRHRRRRRRRHRVRAPVLRLDLCACFFFNSKARTTRQRH